MIVNKALWTVDNSKYPWYLLGDTSQPNRNIDKTGKRGQGKSGNKERTSGILGKTRHIILR